jgi:hypothetical protein
MPYAIIYYTVSITAFACYFIILRAFNLKIVTFSSLSYVFAYITAILPGYEIASGDFYGGRFSRGFDEDLYYIYLLFSWLFPMFLLFGNIIGKRYYIFTVARTRLHLRVLISLAAIFIYSGAYYLWLPENPLNNLIFGRTSLYDLAIQRIQITHQLGDFELNVPFAFRYWRNLMQNLFFILVIYAILECKKNNRFSKSSIFLLIFALLYNLTFTLEKASLIYFIISLFSLKLLNDKVNLKLLLLGLLVVILALVLMITLFMGATNIYDALDALFTRLTEQTCSTYLQIEYIRQNGFLIFRGIYTPFVNYLFPNYYIDLSKIAYETFFSTRDSGNPVGSAAGMALADLYFMFSWYSLPIYALLMCVYGFMDAALNNSTNCIALTSETRTINTSFYIYFMSTFSLMLTGTVFGILSPPFIFSPVVIILIVFYFIYVRFANISLRKL